MPGLATKQPRQRKPFERGYVGKKSKTKLPECSEASSVWGRARAAGASVPAMIFQILARCRAIAAGRKRAELLGAGGHEERAGELGRATAGQGVALARRVARGAPVGVAARQAAVAGARAKLEAARAARAPKPAAPAAPLHEQAMAAAARVPASKRHGESKVFLHHAHEEYQKAGGKLPLEEFKRQLAESPEGRMRLARADMVHTMNREDVRKSNVTYRAGANEQEYNFLKLGEGKPAEKPFSLMQRKATGPKPIENLGRGKTKTLFDMKKGDLPGQTSLLEKVGSVHTHEGTSKQVAKMVQAKHRAGWNITEAEWQAKKPGLIAQLKARAHVQKAALAPMGDQPEQLKRISEREAMAGRRAKTAEALRTMRADITAAKAAKTPEHFAAHAKPGDVGHIPLEHLHRDEPRFQYKQEGIGKKGVTDQFKDVKVWNPHLGGTIQGWRDPADGKVYVVNGHHRLELAERLGVKHVKVELLDATDAAHARAIGAIQNIGEGRGTVRDAATFLHEHGIRDRSELEKHGLSLSEHVTNRGISLASLHPNLYREYKAGNLPEERGAIIGGSGLDHEQQHSLVKSLKPGTSNSKLQEYIDNAREAPKAKQVTHSLFGTHEDEVSLAHHRVDVQDHIKRQLMGDQKLFGLVSKGKAAEALAERGQSHIDVEKTGEISQEAAAVLSAFHTLKNRSGPVARALNDAAEQLHRGEPRERVYKEARERVREEVARMLQGGKESFAA